ncbi:GNAT family N-acetyltransferase [Allorhizocola rhizosphaerae]|uniref:GNAT family N-acetyltransferase n=1 Tax=Allorhizocola rhizosphaerae TaxID=1872709 RepID=UPI000E3DB2E6|nr:GNAT family protein [Allorhizocola rhizosphaerae]
MLVDHWPVAGVILTTEDLELRWPTSEELAALADVAADGVHDPSFMPFFVPWTQGSPAEVARSVILHYWRQAGAFTPEKWSHSFVVFRDGQPMGVQNIGADDFGVTREFHTGSWLGRRFHGQGIGTRMRAAVLQFGFAGLGAVSGRSGAFVGNESSLAVSRKLGYREDGINRIAGPDGQPRIERRLRIDREDWKPPVPVSFSGGAVEGAPLDLAGPSPVPDEIKDLFGIGRPDAPVHP